MPTDDTFPLYDLRVEVIVPEAKHILCGAKKGDYFTLKGEMMFLPDGQGISIYSLVGTTLASVLPLLAAKQRVTHEHDWMTTDSIIACPDPQCPSQLKIVRTGITVFRHSDTTAVPLT
ncbi:TIGR04076 family protein [Aspergillus foveolatus]|uniref:TIGR04076 family protein n=1 Tax=Aspergillus foveolatus TaxID=210207 RepID=UPI003CCDF0AC